MLKIKYVLFLVFVMTRCFVFSQEQIGCQHSRQNIAAPPIYYSAENKRSDTFDVFKYFITLEIGNTANKFIRGNTQIKFAPKLNNQGFIRFDLLKMQVDSVKEANSILNYQYNDTVLRVNFINPKNANDTSLVTIYYHGLPQTDASGWGGFYFDNTGGAQYAYNLGVGFAAKPHNFGRVWHPCFDNFVERAKYQFAITSDTARRAYCNGYLLSDNINGPNRTRTWVMNDEIPTYLASVALANYKQVNWTVNTLSGPTPIHLVAVAGDTTALKNSFVNLPNCILGFENYYGTHAWNRVGYCLVPFNSGAMEHATNIAYPRAAIGSLQYEAELMAHELAHHWWGDLITCETQEDMWINEGMATYSGHLFKEWQYGYNSYITGMRMQHDALLKQLHHKENGFRAISGIPHALTYGDHVYKKGADVAHTLRSYLGDSLFFSSIKYVMQQKAFQSINSAELRDLMQTASGKNLSDFFSNWVFSGGWPHFAIDSVRNVQQSGNNYTVSIGIKQKLYGANNLFNNVPLEISFFKADWSREIRKINFSGASQQYTFALNFEPSATILNYDSKIGDATSADIRTLKTVSAQNLNFGRIRLTVTNTGSDSSFIRVAHNFVKPDPFKNNPANALLSNQHYWKVDGIFSNGFNAKARFTFDGSKAYLSNNGYLDTLLARVNGDSIRLYYRKDAGSDWQMVRPYLFNTLTLKSGYIEIDTLKIGEYTFANFGDTTAVGLKEYNKGDNELILFPNPSKKKVTLKLKSVKDFYNRIELVDVKGKIVYEEFVKPSDEATISIEHLPNGVYMVNVSNGSKRLVSKKLIIQ
jgi:aminopeptidase N